MMEAQDPQAQTGGPQKPKNGLCTHCGIQFESRGMLFRHLRCETGVPSCTSGASIAPRPPPLQRVAALVGYNGACNQIGSIFAKALTAAAALVVVSEDSDVGESPAMSAPEEQPLGLSSVAPPRLKQYYNITVLDDVDPAPVCVVGELASYVPGLTRGADGGVCVPNAVGDVVALDVAETGNSGSFCRNQLVDHANALMPKGCVVLAVAEVPRDFHAEAAVSLRHHQYLLPIQVLVPPSVKAPDPDESEADFRELLQRLKGILKRFEGWHCYHNFLGGTAQPHDSRSSVKRCSHFGQMRFRGELFMCISVVAMLRGEQVCRILTVVAAIMRGFLPVEVVDFVLGESGILEIPPAPIGACVLAELHFSKYEVQTRTLLRPRCPDDERRLDHIVGKGFDHREMLFRSCEDWRLRVMSQIAAAENSDRSVCHWAELELRKWSESAHEQFTRLRHLDTRILVPADSFCEPPVVYAKVLAMLRKLDREGSWPPTSVGRKQVIREVEHVVNAGSFGAGTLPGNCEQPKANKAFPELVDALFELERAISPGRLGSSTIAVNRRASFKPHKDSGTGAGQSCSLIVALGDFVGGELVVEGDVHDICYSPLEFDGWGQRHWTASFLGERFSLVYFTPRGCEDAGWLKNHWTA